MWIQDMGEKITFQEAFEIAESLEFAGYDDWRVPTIKELYSLIDFNGQVANADAIDSIAESRSVDSVAKVRESLVRIQTMKEPFRFVTVPCRICVGR